MESSEQVGPIEIPAATISEIVPEAAAMSVEDRLKLYEEIIESMHHEIAKVLHSIVIINNSTSWGDDEWLEAREGVSHLTASIVGYFVGSAPEGSVQ